MPIKSLLLTIILRNVRNLQHRSPTLRERLEGGRRSPRQTRGGRGPPSRIRRKHTKRRPFPMQSTQAAHPQAMRLSRPTCQRALLTKVRRRTTRNVRNGMRTTSRNVLRACLPRSFQTLYLQTSKALNQKPSPTRPSVPPFRPKGRPTLRQTNTKKRQRDIQFRASVEVFSAVPKAQTKNSKLYFVWRVGVEAMGKRASVCQRVLPHQIQL